MNHQPFRDWLFSEEKLSTDQSRLLQDHLKTCESCQEIISAWSEVESTFHKIPLVDPAPGFTARWQANLVNYQARKQKLQGWTTIGITVIIVTSIAGLLTTLLWTVIQAPGPYLAAWFSRIVNLLSLYFSVQHFINPFNWDIPIFTFTGIFFFIGIASFMSVLWLAAYRKLSFARRII